MVTQGFIPLSLAVQLHFQLEPAFPMRLRLLLLTVVAAILVSSSTELPHESPAPDAFAREAYVTLVTTPSYAIGAETLAKVFLLLFMPCIAYVSGRLYRSALLQIITIAGDSV